MERLGQNYKGKYEKEDVGGCIVIEVYGMDPGEGERERRDVENGVNTLGLRISAIDRATYILAAKAPPTFVYSFVYLNHSPDIPSLSHNFS